MKISIDNFKPNAVEVVIDSGTPQETQILFSYGQPVACFRYNVLYRTQKLWSKTTSRHINEWLDGEECLSAPQYFFDNLLENYAQKGD